MTGATNEGGGISGPACSEKESGQDLGAPHRRQPSAVARTKPVRRRGLCSAITSGTNSSPTSASSPCRPLFGARDESAHHRISLGRTPRVDERSSASHRRSRRHPGRIVHSSARHRAKRESCGLRHRANGRVLVRGRAGHRGRRAAVARHQERRWHGDAPASGPTAPSDRGARALHEHRHCSRDRGDSTVHRVAECRALARWPCLPARPGRDRANLCQLLPGAAHRSTHLDARRDRLGDRFDDRRRTRRPIWARRVAGWPVRRRGAASRNRARDVLAVSQTQRSASRVGSPAGAAARGNDGLLVASRSVGDRQRAGLQAPGDIGRCRVHPAEGWAGLPSRRRTLATSDSGRSSLRRCCCFQRQ